MSELRIAIVAAEPSGDLLGSGLMAALKEAVPAIRFEGIGGPRMLDVGMDCWEPMETLSVMGLFEVLRHLPRLLRLRARVRRRWLTEPPALFIGVDAPDFNLGLECDLRRAGIATVHYVSPTVWAWREKRVHKIRAAVDLLLSIFPFEAAFLARHQVRSEYVGHTLSAEMPMHPHRQAARDRLGISQQDRVLAVLPGSRSSEVSRLARPFLQTAAACRRELPGLRIVVPLVNEKTRTIWLDECRQHAPQLDMQVVMQDSRNVLAAADVVLTASGTATFEGLLSKRPMVVGYKLNTLTYWLARVFRLVKLEHVAMANLLAAERLAPEFIQGECEAQRLAPAVMDFFRSPDKVNAVQKRYADIHRELCIDTDQRAAAAVVGLLRERGLLPQGTADQLKDSVV